MGFLDKMKQGMAGAQAAAAQMGQMPTGQDVEYAQRIKRINDAGVDAPATIRSLTATGRTDPGGGVEYAIDVHVEPAGAAAYDASFTQFMHAATMGSWASEGAAVMVRVDPGDPAAMLLWGGR